MIAQPVRNVRRFRAYNRGLRVWAVRWEALSGGRWRELHRYTLTSGVTCSHWFPTAAEADTYIRGLNIQGGAR